MESQASSLVSRLKARLPRGSTLPDHVWERRNRLMVWIMWAHVVALPIFGLLRGIAPLTAVGAVVPIALCAALAASRTIGRSWREAASTVGLLTSSAVLIAFWGGVVEAHFHFFVVVALLATYESWVPFLLAFLYVALHHGMIGTLLPSLVYDHDEAWGWAAVHAGFIGALGVVCLLTWRLAEDQRDEFRAAFDLAPMGVALVSEEGTILHVNAAITQRLGGEGQSLEGRPLTTILVPEASDRPWPHMTARAVERRFVTADDRDGWGLWQFSRMDVRTWVVHVLDITARKRAETDLSWQAHHDPLTGLPNRALFERSLQVEVARTDRGDVGRGSVAVLFVDLDDFKVVNDSLGHDAGDRLLTVVAERLRRVVRPQDVIARFGGDEFTVLLADVAGEEEALRVADRLAAALRGPVVLDGERRYVTASIGLSMGLPDDPQALLRDADAAMYRAKEQGKSRTAVFDDSMRRAAVERLELETALRSAVARGELHLVYQPLVTLPDGEIVGSEALLRWEHPVHGRITPDRFIGLAEQSGLIAQIGEWVVHEACRQAATWPEPIGVSVNVSPRQLVTTDLPDVIRTALAYTGLAPERLCLEVTETALLADGTAVRRTLDALKALGVRLAIDDFGVGHASLAHLRRLMPVDTLKIDKSFVDGILGEGDDAAIVAGVIGLAHSLGLTVVAEGVEKPEQAERLTVMGCEAAQGYLFARPLEADAFVALLADCRAASAP